MRAVSSVLLLVFVGSGCSGLLNPELIAGRWGQDLSMVESSFEMDLTARGSQITGTGSWYGEACCAGTLSVTGSIEGTHVRLEITRIVTAPSPVPGGVSQFDGTLVSPFLMQGTISYDSSPTVSTNISYQRLKT